MNDDPVIHHWHGQRPMVKMLTGELFLQLGAGDDRYLAALLTEYGRGDQVIEQQPVHTGTLCAIRFPATEDRDELITHLIYGGCSESQAREHLVSIGLGGLPIAWVYPPDATIEAGGDLAGTGNEF
ncbi:hypothetical protein GCM10010174_05170 [Kutzneria viridogrisea]|uniref:Uncharacterized protein n=1 Tax=Kutzneria viridogrisea TaxID=47990 RepID=A0ABR6BBL6_9PSEU|nr:hypothetical protein [Kutzneria viridogrisea]